jgi:beta-glucosidase
MKKWLKITLISLGSLLLILIITGFIGWTYLNNTFLDFEEDFAEKTTFDTLTIDGYSFPDRNGNGRLDAYEDDRRPIKDRVEDLLSQMTPEEKIHLLKGAGIASAAGMTDPNEGIYGAVGLIVPTPRLGLPTLYLADGPAGVRILPVREGDDQTYYCTAFPIATLLASTWNPDLVYEVGNAMGAEAKEYGLDVILGPGANIHRHPLCGRNFEYYSEDPVLTGEMGAAMVNGIESNNVGTSVKHYVVNNQETKRFLNDARLSERALREIYVKGFEIIVEKSQPWTIMSSYNKVNGEYVSESEKLLTEILRDEVGFEGVVMSDWFGGSDAPQMIRAGNDLLEPGTLNQWNDLLDAYEEGTLTMNHIDTAVARILRIVLQSNKMKGYRYSNQPDLDKHALVTRESASEGMVLLKNDSALPIQQGNNVALLGTTSYDFISGGTGSGDVNEAYTVSLQHGLEQAGFEINSVAKAAFDELVAANPEAFRKPEDILSAMLDPYDPPELVLSDSLLQEVVNTSDLGIITIGRNSGEGGDRVEVDDFLLTDQEQDMIERTCRFFHDAGKKVVVVLNIGGVIETSSWKDRPDAILLAWQGGQEGGNSVADILSGRVNPSGKLPMTFPIRLHDHASNENFPLEGEMMTLRDMMSTGDVIPEEEQVQNKDYTIYEEGIYVGYRHFDKEGLEVSYPFGYGLSYTSFDYHNTSINLENDTIRIEVVVNNTGNVAGKEVVQVYSGKPGSDIDRPIAELKTFAKTRLLQPEQSDTLMMMVPVAELSYWNEEQGGWALEPGDYKISVGTSSRDFRSSALITVE